MSALKNKLTNKKFRYAYVTHHVRTIVPYQVRLMRERNGWTQQELADAVKTTQNGISRIEDERYGKLTVNTLLRIAAAFDVALVVKFVPYSAFLKAYEDVSENALTPASFEEDHDLSSVWQPAIAYEEGRFIQRSTPLPLPYQGIVSQQSFIGPVGVWHTTTTAFWQVRSMSPVATEVFHESTGGHQIDSKTEKAIAV